MNATALLASPMPKATAKRGVFGKTWGAIQQLRAKEMIAAAAIVVMASAVLADEMLQDWIPDELSFPEDSEVITDRAIGSTVRMFSIATNADVADLFDDWEDSLGTSGYRITQAQDELLDQSIEFSGRGISNAKIIVAPVTEDGRSIIQFDATLN